MPQMGFSISYPFYCRLIAIYINVRIHKVSVPICDKSLGAPIWLHLAVKVEYAVNIFL